MGTREGATAAPDDLAGATHEPNPFYDQGVAADRQEGSPDRLQGTLAQVRQSLGEARTSADRAVVERLIADVEALVAIIEVAGTSDRSESPAVTAPADLEQ
jgi:hypothetical protein